MNPGTIAIARRGWGYWDTTNYPYGGNFKRLSEDTLVTARRPIEHKAETEVQFEDGRIGVIQNRALST